MNVLLLLLLLIVLLLLLQAGVDQLLTSPSDGPRRGAAAPSCPAPCALRLGWFTLQWPQCCRGYY